jgi:lysophospholipase L1-like esterase
MTCLAAALAGLSAAWGCGAGATPTPAAPTPVVPVTLAIACPGDLVAQATGPQGAVLTWAAPTTTGGTSPVQVSCSPQSGATLPTGQGSVTCTALDATTQRVSCAFKVTVASGPQLSVTKFLAFGDSITWGVSHDAAPGFRDPTPPPDTSYPGQLRSLLAQRYFDQAIVVENDGYSGEAVDTGRTALPGELAKHAPDVLLLLEGANDLLGAPGSATTQSVASKLREMIRDARRASPAIAVLLANFPPQYHPTSVERGTDKDHGAGADFVVEMNQRIAAVAAAEGAELVDLYSPMSAAVKTYISRDGLHPTVAGYTVMANTFFASIQRRFEVIVLTPKAARADGALLARPGRSR